jgi:hypothetical protein
VAKMNNQQADPENRQEQLAEWQIKPEEAYFYIKVSVNDTTRCLK